MQNLIRKSIDTIDYRKQQNCFAEKQQQQQINLISKKREIKILI